MNVQDAPWKPRHDHRRNQLEVSRQSDDLNPSLLKVTQHFQANLLLRPAFGGNYFDVSARRACSIECSGISMVRKDQGNSVGLAHHLMIKQRLEVGPTTRCEHGDRNWWCHASSPP